MKKILFLFALIWSFGTHASNIEHVNIGRITVSDQSVRSQQLAGKQALAQVFVKISGNPLVLNTTEIARAVDNYEQFLVSSSFLQQKNDWIFEATFNQQKVEQLLMATGLNVWTSLRPSAVLWLAKEELGIQSAAIEDKASQTRGDKVVRTDITDGQSNTSKTTSITHSSQRILLSENQEIDLGNLVKNLAYQRGVDIIIPLGDLDDAVNISVYDVWNQFISRLLSHSSRYNTDYVISATMQPYSQDLEQAERNIDIIKNERAIENKVLGDSLRPNAMSDELTEPEIVGFELPEASSTKSDTSFDMLGQDTTSLDEFQNMPEVAVPRPQMLAPEGTTHKLDYVITNSSRVHTGRLYGEGENQLVIALVNKYADLLALEFSLGGSPNSQERPDLASVSLVVGNIRDLRDYVEFKQLLESVPAVSLVKLEKQSSTTAHFRVDQNISKQQLSAILSLDKRVQVDLSTQQKADLHFIWQD